MTTTLTNQIRDLTASALNSVDPQVWKQFLKQIQGLIDGVTADTTETQVGSEVAGIPSSPENVELRKTEDKRHTEEGYTK